MIRHPRVNPYLQAFEPRFISKLKSPPNSVLTIAGSPLFLLVSRRLVKAKWARYAQNTNWPPQKMAKSLKKRVRSCLKRITSFATAVEVNVYAFLTDFTRTWERSGLKMLVISLILTNWVAVDTEALKDWIIVSRYGEINVRQRFTPNNTHWIAMVFEIPIFQTRPISEQLATILLSNMLRDLNCTRAAPCLLYFKLRMPRWSNRSSLIITICSKLFVNK